MMPWCGEKQALEERQLSPAWQHVKCPKAVLPHGMKLEPASLDAE